MTDTHTHTHTYTHTHTHTMCMCVCVCERESVCVCVHSEFQSGWIDKAVLMPVVKACFTHTFSSKEIRVLLSSEVLKSMVSKCFIHA